MQHTTCCIQSPRQIQPIGSPYPYMSPFQPLRMFPLYPPPLPPSLLGICCVHHQVFARRAQALSPPISCVVRKRLGSLLPYEFEQAAAALQIDVRTVASRVVCCSTCVCRTLHDMCERRRNHTHANPAPLPRLPQHTDAFLKSGARRCTQLTHFLCLSVCLCLSHSPSLPPSLPPLPTLPSPPALVLVHTPIHTTYVYG